MANWVLKFISGKYQGGEFPLEEGREYLVGRSSDCALVLVEDMVSRQHAKLVVHDDVPSLIDLGSTNGSFVNGERVKNVPLKEGDRVLFGTSIIKLMRAGQPTSEAANPFDAQTRAPSVVTPRPTPATPQRQGGSATVAGAMAGLLEEIALPDLLQLFSGSRKNGVLRLRNDLSEAALYLREGRVVHAEIMGFPDLSGEKAAYRVLTWNRGTFVLEPPSDRKFEEEIQMSTEALMMEAMRLLDEMENIRHDMPDPQSVLALKRPLVPPLRSLTPELLDTLQLVINFGMVETILNKSLGSDFETVQDLESLLRQGYIEKIG